MPRRQTRLLGQKGCQALVSKPEDPYIDAAVTAPSGASLHFPKDARRGTRTPLGRAELPVRDRSLGSHPLSERRIVKTRRVSAPRGAGRLGAPARRDLRF